MKWKDILSRTLNLGFEKVRSYEKNRQSYLEAYNWGRNFIASTQRVCIDLIKVEKKNRGRASVHDLRRLAASRGREFVALARAGVFEGETGERIPAAIVSDNRFLHLPANFRGEAVVRYMTLPVPLKEAGDEDFVCPLPEKWAAALPYLMASRLYLDDDPGKAGYYWNLYDDMKNQMLARENSPLATVVREGGGDLWAG